MGAIGRSVTTSGSGRKAIAHALREAGLSYRLNRADLPGRPTIVVRKAGAVIFVRNCFASRHHGCTSCTTPQTRRRFWQTRFNRTGQDDDDARHSLIISGWRVAVIWECAVAESAEKTAAELVEWLEGSSPKFETRVVATTE